MKYIYLKISSFGHRLHQFLGLPYALNAEVYGSPGPTVVLLHGINGKIANWTYVIDELQKTHRVIAIDLLGFGKSQSPDNMRYSAKDHIKSIKHTLNKLDIDKPFILVGHSMGAILAVNYAGTYRKDVSRLVLCSLPYYKSTDIHGRIGARWSNISDKMLLSFYRQLRKRPKTTIRGAKILRSKDKRFAFELSHTNWYPFHQSLLHTIEEQKLTPRFKKLKVQTDLVYGKKDRFLNHQNLRQLAKLYPNINSHTYSAGHELTKDFSSQISKVISKN